MSRKIKWERAALAGRQKRSIKDEAEFIEDDRAARWLNAVEQRHLHRGAAAEPALLMQRQTYHGAAADPASPMLPIKTPPRKRR
jgi:hypothetical protein